MSLALADEVLDLAIEKAFGAAHSRHPELEHDPARWLTTVLPAYFPTSFAPHHLEFLDDLWSITLDNDPAPNVNIWSRGHAKSTLAEGGAAALGARNRRRYGLYVCRTQDQADDHVQNIAGMFESREMEHWYPEVADRLVGKYGNSKGWRVDRLRCRSGFTIDAVGLDTAARGVKLDEQRPDFIILDDIDHEHDSLETIVKNKRTITQGLIPAGTKNVAVIAVQNLIRKDGIFADLAGLEVPDETGRPVQGPTFLQHRKLSGPIPALIGMETGRDDQGRVVVTAGSPTWAGFTVDDCNGQVLKMGISAFRNECQHEAKDPAGGMFDELEFDRINEDELPELTTVAVAVDPAVTDKKDSDACGVQADGLGVDGRIYRLASIERRMSPLAALRAAILLGLELQADVIVLEDDQGKDTWQSVYREAWDHLVRQGDIAADVPVIPFRQETAGSVGSKVGRAARHVAAYELGWFVHVRGDHEVLEAALHRFPKKKPFDLVDAGFWSARALRPEIDRLSPSRRWNVVNTEAA